MEKLFAVFAIIISLSASAQIASKSLGTDPETGLNQVLKISQFSCDDDAKVVLVIYHIDLIAPNGKIAKKGDNKTYMRYNKFSVNLPAGDTTFIDMRYDALKASTVGQMLKGLFANDLVPVNVISDLGNLNQ